MIPCDQLPILNECAEDQHLHIHINQIERRKNEDLMKSTFFRGNLHFMIHLYLINGELLCILSTWGDVQSAVPSDRQNNEALGRREKVCTHIY